MADLIDIQGQRFGRLVVESRDPSRTSPSRALWFCRCDCGTIVSVNSYALRHGRTASCGCLNRDRAADRIRERSTTHGRHNTPEYRVWDAMKQRCFNPRSERHRNYGERGITVCQQWADSFATFYADMGPRPSSQHSIERIDNDGNYEPQNCRWATRQEQARNRRQNRLITHNGKTLPAIEWAEATGVSLAAIYHRLNQGWSVERTLTTPLARRAARAPRSSGHILP